MFNAFRWLSTTLRRPHHQRKTRSARLVLEPLEDRCVPTGGLFVVDNAGDGVDGNHGAGQLTLREAVLLANNNAGADTINFAAGITTVTLTDGELLLTDADTTTIGGNSVTIARSTADGTPEFRIVNVAYGASAALSGLTLTNGRADYGGGILNDGTLTVTDSTITANSAVFDGGGIKCIGGTLTVSNSTLSANVVSYAGGGIFNFIGAVTVTNSTLSGNSAGSGGGIANAGGLTVIDSTLSDNSSSSGGGIFNSYTGGLTVTHSTLSANSAIGGGGIFNEGVLTVTHSTLSANTAVESGGGIVNGIINNEIGTLTVTHSTLTANAALADGGGIFNQGVLTVTNSTLSANSAGDSGGGISNFEVGTLTVTNSTLTANAAAESGGGIANLNTVTLNNSIVAGNTLSDGTPADINNTIDTAHNNLIGDANSSGGISHGNNGNIVGNNGSGTRDINTILDTTLADNDGPTHTHALVAGSPAINAGADARAVDAQGNALEFDQRGDGYPRFVGTVDIGAFEATDSTPPDTSISAMPSLVSTRITADFTFTGTDNFTTPANLTFEVKLDNGAAFTPITGSSFTTPTLSEGSHTLQVRAVDQAGNVDASPASYTWTVTSVSGPIVVDNAGDGVDGDLGEGQFTLREAVLLANDHTGTDTIDFAASITTVTLTDGELLLTDAATTTILGNGVTIARSTADGTPEFRIVLVETVASAALSGLTLTNGRANSGGGIYNAGTLTVINSTLSANSASGGNGGGIFNGATLTVINSTLTANATNLGNGGGIYNAGTLTVTNSTLTANSVNHDVGDIGGGIFAGGTETLNNTIVAGNILSNVNFSSNGTAPEDIFGTIETANNNLIGDANSSGGISHGSNGNIVGNNGSGTRDINTILDTTLADNDGPTRTHALVAGSPAINAGADALAVDAQGITLQFDQRGDGFPRIRGGTVDIGAFEIYVPPNANAGGPYQINEGQDLELDASASTSPIMATLTTFSWDINGDNEYGDATGSNPTVTWARLRELGIDDDSGTRQVTVQVTDAGGAMDISDPVTLTIMNEAPTATLTNSGPVTAGSTATVTNSNPFDPSSADTEAGFHYAYDFNNDGDFEVGDGTYPGSPDSPSVTVPAEFLANPGSNPTVRARIIDKDGGFTENLTSITVEAKSHFNSPIGIDPGGVRGQSLNGVIARFMPADGDVPAEFTVVILWGDGTQSEADVTAFADGSFGVVGQHVYDAAGEFAIQALITHSDNSNVQISSSAVVTVTSLDETTGRLLIGGTPGIDVIVITPTDTPGVVQVSINGVVHGPFQAEAIAAYGSGGNDTLRVGTLKVGTRVHRVQVPTLLHGGAGNDKLDALDNKGSTMLVGGAGNDTLTGSKFRDILIGGQGRDSLKGVGGDNILVGDVFAAEDDLDLSFILLGEWARTDLKFTDRKESFARVFNEQTLVSDTAGDQLFGGAGKDWFLRRRSRPVDVVRDQLPGDIVTGLP